MCDDGSSDEEDEEVQKEKKGPGVSYAKRLFEPVFPGSRVTVLMAIFFLFSWRDRYKVSREGMDAMLSFLAH